jgi:hypothetical protein
VQHETLHTPSSCAVLHVLTRTKKLDVFCGTHMFSSVETQDSLKNAKPPPPPSSTVLLKHGFCCRVWVFWPCNTLNYRKTEPFHILKVCWWFGTSSHRRASRFYLGLVVAGHNQKKKLQNMQNMKNHASGFNTEPCNAQKDKSKRALERAQWWAFSISNFYQ